MSDPRGTGLPTNISTDTCIDTARWCSQINQNVLVTTVPGADDARDFAEYWCQWAGVPTLTYGDQVPETHRVLQMTTIPQRWIWEKTVRGSDAEVRSAARQWYRDRWFNISVPIERARQLAAKLQALETSALLDRAMEVTARQIETKEQKSEPATAEKAASGSERMLVALMRYIKSPSADPEAVAVLEKPFPAASLPTTAAAASRVRI